MNTCNQSLQRQNWTQPLSLRLLTQLSIQFFYQAHFIALYMYIYLLSLDANGSVLRFYKLILSPAVKLLKKSLYVLIIIIDSSGNFSSFVFESINYIYIGICCCAIVKSSSTQIAKVGNSAVIHLLFRLPKRKQSIRSATLFINMQVWNELLS